MSSVEIQATLMGNRQGHRLNDALGVRQIPLTVHGRRLLVQWAGDGESRGPCRSGDGGVSSVGLQ